MTPLSAAATPTLYIFIDESGNFDFSDRGTEHFVMAGVATLSPIESAAVMHRLRYQLLAQGVDVPSFHAAEDRQFVRDGVYDALAMSRGILAHAIYGEKRRAAPQLQSDSRLHSLFGRALIRYFLEVFNGFNYRQVVVIFDQALTKRKQGDFQGFIKSELKTLGKPFHVYFQRMMTDMNGQIADYVAWSKYVQLERGEQRPWARLGGTLAPSDFNIFRNGHTVYY